MNLLDDVELPKQQTRASLTKKATRLIGRRPQRRSKIKKPKPAKWRKEYAQALKDHEEMKREFTRKVGG